MNDEKILVSRSSMPLYEEYVEAIKPLWDSHWLTNMGKYHVELEQKLKAYLDVPELSLMVNGHMALEMIIQAFEFPEGSEIITTPFTFISTTHAIVRNHLVPVFCDVKLSDGTIDESQIENLITKKTVAILPVHVYGNICNIEAIDEIAKRHHLKVIYDAAHAFGTSYKGRTVGNFGDATIFSFHATKVFNTIEGGAVAFCNAKLYQKLYNLKNFGIRGEESVISVGANAKMNEFSAIMGLCNLNRIEKTMENRKGLWKYYIEKLSGIQGIERFSDSPEVQKNYAYFPILVKNDYSLTRNDLYDLLQKYNIYTRKYFYPIIADQICYRDKYGKVELPVARDLASRVLILPFYEGMDKKVIDKITKIIRDRNYKIEREGDTL